MRAQVAADLRRAADLLKRDGWAQGGLSPGGGHLCAIEACYAAAPNLRAAMTATDQLRAYIGRRVTEWNDAPGRTAAEVIAALRAAADQAEAVQ